MTIPNTFNGKFIDNENESLRTIEIAKTVSDIIQKALTRYPELYKKSAIVKINGKKLKTVQITFINKSNVKTPQGKDLHIYEAIKK